MEFWRATLGLVRRRYVALPVLIASIGVAVLAYLLTPPRYVSSTIMVLTTPTSGGTLSQDKPPGLTNPLLNFDDGLRTTSAILIQAMRTPDVARELGIEGGGTKLTVDDGSSNPSLLGVNGPFVHIEGLSTNASEAKAVVQRAQQRVRDELVNRQKALNAPPSTYITIVDVVAPSNPEVQRGTQLQYAGAGLVLTIIGGLAGAYCAERVFAARRRRTAAAQPAAPQPPRPTDVDRNAVDPATVRFAPAPHPHPTNGNGTRVPAPAHPAPPHHPAAANPPAPAQPSGPAPGIDAPRPKPVRTR